MADVVHRYHQQRPYVGRSVNLQDLEWNRAWVTGRVTDASAGTRHSYGVSFPGNLSAGPVEKPNGLELDGMIRRKDQVGPIPGRSFKPYARDRTIDQFAGKDAPNVGELAAFLNRPSGNTTDHHKGDPSEQQPHG